jgi:YidC/Oxa1 family membrane protein insertase
MEPKANRNEKSISYENKYTEIYFEHKDGKVDYAGLGAENELLEKPTFIAFKQHFFSTISFQTPFENAQVTSTNLMNDEKSRYNIY